MSIILFGTLVTIPLALSQFTLPNIQKEPPKPTIPKGLESYFGLQPQLSNIFNPVLEGVLPQQSFGYGGGSTNGFKSSVIPATLQTSAGSTGSLAHSNFGSIIPGLFGPLSGSARSTPRRKEAAGDSGDDNSTSSIVGIPDIFPSLPQAPLTRVDSGAGQIPSLLSGSSLPFQQLVQAQQNPRSPIGSNGNLGSVFPGLTGQSLGSLGSGPLGPALTAILGGATGNAGQTGLGNGDVSVFRGDPDPFNPKTIPTGATAEGQVGQQSEGQDEETGVGGGKILSRVIEALGRNILGSIGSGGQAGSPNLTPVSLDPSSLNSVLGGAGSPALGGPGDVLSTVLFSALSDSGSAIRSLGNKTKSKDGKRLQANAAMLQSLFTQASSPLCNPKPVPVSDFDLRAFMGSYYQVVYSPPMSLGPCSMISFTDVGVGEESGGGAGSIFNLFEYTTEGTPNGKPQISSGYAMVRAPGQLVFQTSSNPSPLNVYVLRTGEMNMYGQYPYIVLSINCNYPIYVYARDPVEFKQMYEQEVTEMLAERGLASTWARLFNIVAPVDNNLCNFPPTVFNA